MGKAIMQNKSYERRFFDDIADNHLSQIPGTLQSQFILSNLLLADIDLKGEMLECGCGAYGYGKNIMRVFKALNVTGIDISQKTIDMANRRKKWAICGDVENKWTFKEGQFDSVSCFFFLHHLPDIKTTIDNIVHWLKPGGILIIMDCNPNNLLFKISNLLRRMFEFFGGTEYLIKHRMATPNETIHPLKSYFVNDKLKLIRRSGFYMHNQLPGLAYLFHRLYFRFMGINKLRQQHILLIFKKEVG